MRTDANISGKQAHESTDRVPDRPFFEVPALQRIARAIYESKLLVQPREPWAGGKANVTEIFCMQGARSILNSIMEPTSPMLARGSAAAEVCDDGYESNATWMAMINAALEET